MSRVAFKHLLLLIGLLAALSSNAAAAAPFSLQRISVLVTGKGPDVVLIPGLAASRGVWGRTVSAVPGYRYHLVQVAGFAGEPARGNARGRVAASVADELARYIAHKRLKRPALVGHSMGGTIAMMIAARHPQMAGKVMVVDMVPAPAQLFGASASAVRPLADLLRTELAGVAAVRQQLKQVIGRFGSTDWMESRSDTDVVARSLHEMAVTDMTPELANVGVPLLVVYACPEPSRLTRPAVDRLYARAYARKPDATLIRIDRSGHTIMADQPARFRQVLKRFLK